MIRANTLHELQARLTATLDAKAGQLASGAISPSQFVVEAEELLSFAHSRAAVLGSFRARRHNPPTDVAIRIAAQASAEQRDFLIGFVQDLANGVYKPKAQGGRGARQRKARFALYSLRLGGTSNLAWLETLRAGKPDLEVLWVRHASESCQDCRVEASYGWRQASSLTRVPGSGQTQCMVRCHCRLRTREGAESYAL
jgi:hypothetical protein